MVRVIQVEEDKWYHFARKDNLVCCDCNLSHSLVFQIKNKKIYIKFKRDERATAAFRRSKLSQKTIKNLLK